MYPSSSDPFYLVSYYIKWITTSSTYSTNFTQPVRFAFWATIWYTCPGQIWILINSPFLLVSFCVNGSLWKHVVVIGKIAIFIYLDKKNSERESKNVYTKKYYRERNVHIFSFPMSVPKIRKNVTGSDRKRKKECRLKRERYSQK